MADWLNSALKSTETMLNNLDQVAATKVEELKETGIVWLYQEIILTSQMLGIPFMDGKGKGKGKGKHRDSKVGMGDKYEIH